MQRWSCVLALVLLALMASVKEGTAQQAWNSVTLTWTTPGNDSLSGTASQFDIRYSTAAITPANFAAATRWTTGVPVPAVAGTVQNTVVTGLSPSTTYWFAIKTADAVPNWSGISNVATRTTTAAPDSVRPAPIALSITARTDSTITLGWAAVGNDSLTGTATSYDVRMSTSAITAGNFASATAVTGVPAPAVSGTAQSVTVKNLSRRVTYWFAIKAADAAGNVSAISNVPSATTPDTAPPAAITDLRLGLVWMGFSGAAVTPRGAHDR